MGVKITQCAFNGEPDKQQGQMSMEDKEEEVRELVTRSNVQGGQEQDEEVVGDQGQEEEVQGGGGQGCNDECCQGVDTSRIVQLLTVPRKETARGLRGWREVFQCQLVSGKRMAVSAERRKRHSAQSADLQCKKALFHLPNVEMWHSFSLVQSITGGNAPSY